MFIYKYDTPKYDEYVLQRVRISKKGPPSQLQATITCTASQIRPLLGSESTRLIAQPYLVPHRSYTLHTSSSSLLQKQYNNIILKHRTIFQHASAHVDRVARYPRQGLRKYFIIVR